MMGLVDDGSRGGTPGPVYEEGTPVVLSDEYWGAKGIVVPLRVGTAPGSYCVKLTDAGEGPYPVGSVIQTAPEHIVGVDAVELDLNRVVELVRAFLAFQYPEPMSGGWEITLTDEVGNAWLFADARPQMPYERGMFPAELSFAVFRATGALHLVVNGEVQDPALEVPA